MKWINIDDSKEIPLKTRLLICQDNFVDIATFDGKYFESESCETWFKSEVTHWMPLPEVPNEMD